jgi:hypothetical protein
VFGQIVHVRPSYAAISGIPVVEATEDDGDAEGETEGDSERVARGVTDGVVLLLGDVEADGVTEGLLLGGKFWSTDGQSYACTNAVTSRWSSALAHNRYK